jgi:23S rRNA pseudouridine1911/1915/1917 synthase
MKKVIIAHAGDAGKRLDVFLAEKLKHESSRSQVKRLITEGKVLIEGKVKKANYRLKGKERLEVIFPDIKETNIAPENIPLDIVYEDDDILVVNKPSGMVVHPAAGNPEHTLVNAALFHTKGKLAHLDTSPRPGIIHRLDKEVSGLLLVAKTDCAYKGLLKQFQDKTIKRKYIAFVKGVVSQDEGRTALPIGRAARDRKKMAVRFLNAKEAATRYKVLKRFSSYTKLELNLETGRTHQIRVHTSYMGNPIIGDTKYGGGKFKRIALYAAELSLKHPRTGQDMRFAVNMPDELKELERNNKHLFIS